MWIKYKKFGYQLTENIPNTLYEVNWANNVQENDHCLFWEPTLSLGDMLSLSMLNQVAYMITTAY
jgi:hypothetical protein